METEAMQAVSRAIESFTNDFYKSVAGRAEGNLVCSALSAHVVLSMAAHGAEGNTAKQMKKSLRLNESETLAKQGFQHFIDSLKTVEDVILKVANKIYASHHLTIKDGFKEVTKSSFRSESETVNFDQTSEAVKLINKWCADNTSNKINEIVVHNDIHSNTCMILLNAVYFKGDWLDKFDADNTKPTVFHLHKNSNIEVPTMFIKKKFYHGVLDDLKAQYVGIPYKNEDLLMVLVIPDEIEGLSDIEKNLDKFNLDYQSHFARGFKTEINLYLPRFKIESTIELNEILQELGMNEMFTDAANFNGISEAPLRVDKVVQKAFIEVNEEGSEAAAVTAIRMVMRCMPLPPTEIRADRPFFYKIVDKKRNVTLFSGRVTNPAQ